MDRRRRRYGLSSARLSGMGNREWCVAWDRSRRCLRRGLCRLHRVEAGAEEFGTVGGGDYGACRKGTEDALDMVEGGNDFLAEDAVGRFSGGEERVMIKMLSCHVRVSLVKVRVGGWLEVFLGRGGLNKGREL